MHYAVQVSQSSTFQKPNSHTENADYAVQACTVDDLESWNPCKVGGTSERANDHTNKADYTVQAFTDDDLKSL